MGHADDGESVIMRAQRTDAKKALLSVRKMNLGGNAIWMAEKGTRRTRRTVRGRGSTTRMGQGVTYLWLPSKGESVQEETEQVVQRDRFATWAAESEQVSSRRVCELQVRTKMINKFKR